ncbi:MAG: GTP 3',8-cyclase MoaA [Chitinophagaceae bacterium]|nr:GTP 3',8-cyclase MoaA [Oligoflexus sp.]
MARLIDSYQRRFRYLRLSITDSCNFRCSYCLPNGSCIDPEAERPLNLDEIIHLTTAFAGLGVEKVRITGGEPTLRRDVIEIMEAIHQVDGIEHLAISTNGYRLSQLASRLVASGCTAANISLDSLNPAHFAKVTGQTSNKAVIGGIDASLESGMKVKINAVLMKGVNDIELPNFLDYVRDKPVAVRFIELMRTGDNKAFFDKHHIRAEVLADRLVESGWSPLARSALGGPATEYAHPDFAGRLGFITPYAKNFCDQCNRLRISCRGELKLCLFGDGQESIRHLLKAASQKEELQETILQRLTHKKASHALHDDDFGTTRQLASIGG